MPAVPTLVKIADALRSDDIMTNANPTRLETLQSGDIAETLKQAQALLTLATRDVRHNHVFYDGHLFHREPPGVLTFALDP